MRVDPKTYMKNLRTKPASYWRQIGLKSQRSLFSKMSKQVVAYQKFLKTNRVKFGLNKSGNSEIPTVNKSNYFRAYQIKDLIYHSQFDRGGLIGTSTSGSTGEPTYFLRNQSLEWQYSIILEQFIRLRTGTTLFVNCFGMGVWIGGVLTYQAAKLASERVPGITIFTPGIHTQEIFHILTQLAPAYDSVILAGYPPFIKDVLADFAKNGKGFEKGKYRLIFAAEGFTESFRDYVGRLARVQNVLLDTMNIYGSAELGAMAFETPFSVFTRRMLLKHRSLYAGYFLADKLPTLAQYVPDFIQFEEINKRVIISADSAMPCFRYDIGDSGGVYDFDRIMGGAKAFGLDLIALAKRAKIPIYQLPFVYVYERLDFSTKLYGAIIYPEHIRQALQKQELSTKVTGRFTMLTKSGSNHNQMLEINIELNENLKPNKKLVAEATTQIVKALVSFNAEYRNNYLSMKKKMTPRIVLWVHGHPKYFKIGIKQKWVIKA